MPASARRSGICSTSPAALGVVKVGPDFHYEFPDGDPAATEAFATILRYGQTARADLERTMLASFGAPQNVLNSLAVIEGAQSVDLVRDFGQAVTLLRIPMMGGLPPETVWHSLQLSAAEVQPPL